MDDGIEEQVDALIDEVDREFKAINTATENWKAQPMPLARVRKIMRNEEICVAELERRRVEETEGATNQHPQRFMIAGEGPVIVGKACEFLIKELSLRAWKHTAQNGRTTLQRRDVHAAAGESEIFDFLIDLVPRVIVEGGDGGGESQSSAPTTSDNAVAKANQGGTGGDATPAQKAPAASRPSLGGAGDAVGGGMEEKKVRRQQQQQQQQPQAMTVSEASLHLAYLRQQEQICMALKQQAMQGADTVLGAVAGLGGGVMAAAPNPGASVTAAHQNIGTNPFAAATGVDPAATAQWASAMLGQQQLGQLGQLQQLGQLGQLQQLGQLEQQQSGESQQQSGSGDKSAAKNANVSG